MSAPGAYRGRARPPNEPRSARAGIERATRRYLPRSPRRLDQRARAKSKRKLPKLSCDRSAAVRHVVVAIASRRRRCVVARTTQVAAGWGASSRASGAPMISARTAARCSRGRRYASRRRLPTSAALHPSRHRRAFRQRVCLFRSAPRPSRRLAPHARIAPSSNAVPSGTRHSPFVDPGL